MSMGTALDVALGLILTYLLVGMLASSCQELVAGALKLRGKGLFGALDRLLADGTAANDPASLAAQLKQHGLITPMGTARPPSYLPARNFSLALIDTLSAGSQAPVFGDVEARVAKLAPSPARDSLATFVRRAAGDLDALRDQVETWFDDAMDRASGEYKRFSQAFLLGFGLFVAIAFNIDSIHIATTLWTEPAAARSAIVQAAATAAASDPTAQAQGAAALQQLEALPLPIGWLDVSKKVTDTSNPVTLLFRAVFEDGAHGVWRVLGWILTAFGVSLGAPFWFGALQKMLNLRAAGPKPARSDA